MYLAEAMEIFAYWERHPPVYQLVSIIAQGLGWKPAAASSAMPAATGSPTDNILAGAAKLGVAVTHGGDAGMPAPILDLDAFRERNRQRMLDIALRNAARERAMQGS